MDARNSGAFFTVLWMEEVVEARKSGALVEAALREDVVVANMDLVC